MSDEAERFTSNGREELDPADSATESGNIRFDNLEKDLAETRDRWMRSEAENANVRSRAKRDVEDARQFAVQKFSADVVEAAENLRRGLDSIPALLDGEPEIVTRIRDGFLGVERSFIEILRRNGVMREDPTGSHFDPSIHQAMAETFSSEKPSGTVAHALSATWTLNGRLLRPAMVIVTKGTTTDVPGDHSSSV